MRGRSAAPTAPADRSRGTTALTDARPSAVALDAALAGPSKRGRHRAIRELVATAAIASQQDLVERLTARGHVVTQATVSRDIAELGLVKAPRLGGHVYVLPETLGNGGPDAPAATPTDDRLLRILADIPVTIGRSGLILLVTGSPGTASIIAQAIDESSLTEQEGTLAGDNTLLVLFADDERLIAWRQRFDDILDRAAALRPGR